MGHSGLACATSIAAITNFTTLYACMNRISNLQSRYFVDNLLRCGIAASMLGMVCWGFNIHYSHWLYSPILLIKMLALFVTIVCASAVYLLLCMLLKVEGITKQRSGAACE